MSNNFVCKRAVCILFINANLLKRALLTDRRDDMLEQCIRTFTDIATIVADWADYETSFHLKFPLSLLFQHGSADKRIIADRSGGWQAD